MKVKTLIVIALLAILCLAVYAGKQANPWVEKSKCVGCGDCLRACPTGAVSLSHGRAVIDDELCINCKFCVQSCTYRAVRSPL